jgi:hypothetical protein
MEAEMIRIVEWKVREAENHEVVQAWAAVAYLGKREKAEYDGRKSKDGVESRGAKCLDVGPKNALMSRPKIHCECANDLQR